MVKSYGPSPSSYKSGDSWGICDVCGFRYYKSQLSMRWDGLMVCSSDQERRQPQDTVKAVKEKIYVENPRPEAADKFLVSEQRTSWPFLVFAPGGEITEEDL